MTFSDIISADNIRLAIGTDWQYGTPIFDSKSWRTDMTQWRGSDRVTWIRSKVLEGDPDGQTIGIDTVLTPASMTQKKYQIPVVNRGSRIYVDEVFEDINSANRDYVKKIEGDYAAKIQDKVAQYTEGLLIRTLEGASAAITANQYTTSSQFALTDFTEAARKRGDSGVNKGGNLICKSDLVYKLESLGLDTRADTTYSDALKDNLLRNGNVDKYLRYVPVSTDRLTDPDDDNEYAYIVEEGALILGNPMMPTVSIVEADDRMGEYIKYRIITPVGMEGVSYGGTINDEITNSDLATSTNWESALEYDKNIPVVRIQYPNVVL
jgi:hypothetical protein